MPRHQFDYATETVYEGRSIHPVLEKRGEEGWQLAGILQDNGNTTFLFLRERETAPQPRSSRDERDITADERDARRYRWLRHEIGEPAGKNSGALVEIHEMDAADTANELDTQVDEGMRRHPLNSD